MKKIILLTTLTASMITSASADMGFGGMIKDMMDVPKEIIKSTTDSMKEIKDSTKDSMTDINDDDDTETKDVNKSNNKK